MFSTLTGQSEAFTCQCQKGLTVFSLLNDIDFNIPIQDELTL
jgi:hypothetical protein